MSKHKSQSKKTASVEGQVIEEVLQGLNYVSELLTLPPYAGPRHNVEARMMQDEWKRMYSGDMQKQRALRDLRRKKWLESRNVGNETVVKIYSDAIVAALKNRILSTTKLLKDSICLLAYDFPIGFPIGADKARKSWHKLLIKIGMKKEQLSLFSTNLDIGIELKALAKALGVEKWVQIYSASKR
jgi:hypothetical protein